VNFTRKPPGGRDCGRLATTQAAYLDGHPELGQTPGRGWAIAGRTEEKLARLGRGACGHSVLSRSAFINYGFPRMAARMVLQQS
jgi:hypothetical protein